MPSLFNNTVLTLVQFINKFIFDRPVNIIKIQIIKFLPTGYSLF